MNRNGFLAAGLAVLAVVAAPVMAQQKFPTKPVTIVVPYQVAESL